MLSDINSNNVLRVIDDFELESAGYKINYIFDAYDVISYCFPNLGNRKIKDRVSKDDLIDNYLAYNYFFFDNDSKPIIPSEYILELLHFKSKSNYKIRELKGFRNKISDFTSKINIEYTDGYRSLLEFCRKNVKIIAAFLAGKYSVSAVDEFERILKTETNEFYESIDFYSVSSDSDLINRDIVNQVYEEFKDSVYRKIKRRSIEDRFLYFDSVYRDIEVACKVINSNKKSIALNNNELYFFTSSTPVRSKLIFGIFDRIGYLPAIKGFNNYPILRNKKELYLKFLFKKYSSDFLERKELLNELLQIALEAEEVDMEDKDDNSKSLSYFDSIAENSRLNVESNLILSQLELMPSYRGYSKHLEKMINSIPSDETIRIDNLKDFFLKLGNLLEDVNFKEFTQVSVQEHYLSYRIRNDLNEIINQPSPTLRNLKGKDIIRGTYHHLPLLLFYEREMDDEIQALISNITEKCALSFSHGDVEITEDIFELINKFYRKYGYSKESSIEVVLIKVFLLLLMPLPKKNEKTLGNRKNELIETCETLLSISRNFTYRKEKREYNYEVDIYYLLIWLHRRELNLDSAILVAIEGTEKYGSSPRLYHGLGLAYLAKFYENYYLKGNYSSGEALLVKSKDAIQLAYDFYLDKKGKPDILETKNESLILILSKTISAVQNTLAVIEAKLYQSNRDKRNLTSARNFLNLIKEEKGNEDNDFLLLSEYNHTEADIEYQEAYQLFIEGDYKKALSKLDFAKKRMSLSLELNGGSSYALIDITSKNISKLEKQIRQFI